MKRAARLLLLVCTALLLLSGCHAGSGDSVYVLMYHQIVEDDQPHNSWSVTVSSLRSDLEWLRDNGYHTILPRDLVSGDPLPEKPVMITFDDGYLDNYTLGFPLFQEYGQKCAIALITSLTDAAGPFDGVLHWDECLEMEASGLVEFGSHTHDLHNMSGQDEGGPLGVEHRKGETREEYADRVLADLQKSIDTMTEHLGHAPVYLAYPHGRTDPWADEFIEEHFSVTVTTKYGVAHTGRGFYNMPRRNVTVETPVSELIP